jgi:hypothetical protein
MHLRDLSEKAKVFHVEDLLLTPNCGLRDSATKYPKNDNQIMRDGLAPGALSLG